jgi:hypothetical protein
MAKRAVAVLSIDDLESLVETLSVLRATPLMAELAEA